MILTILFACISPRLPPKTVKSCEKTKTVRPSIVPWPVTTPSPSTRSASLEDLEGSFEELVLRSLVVRDDERTVRRDVVRLADHSVLPDHRRHPLPNRGTLPAVVLQEEFDSRVSISRIQVVDLVQKIVEEFLVRDEEVHFSLERRGFRLDFGRELVQVHIRVHADADDDVVHVVAVDALGEDPCNLSVLIHRVVRVLQAREYAEVTQRLHDRHPDEQAPKPGMRLLRSQDERCVQPAEGRGPCSAVSSPTRGLSVRPDDEAFLHVGLEELLRGLVRLLDRVEMKHRPADRLAVRVVNLAGLQRQVGRARRYFNVRVRRASARGRASELSPSPGPGGTLRTSQRSRRARRHTTAIAYSPNPKDQANWFGRCRPSHWANTRDANARLITVAPSEIAAPSKLRARTPGRLG